MTKLLTLSPSHPSQEAHFCHLYQVAYSELVTMGEGGSNKFQKLVHCVKFK